MNATERGRFHKAGGPVNLKKETGHPSMEASLLSQHSDAYWRGLTPVKRVKNFTDCLHIPKTERISAALLWLDSGFIAPVKSKQSQACMYFVIFYFIHKECRRQATCQKSCNIINTNKRIG